MTTTRFERVAQLRVALPATTGGADAQIDRVAKEYIGQNRYPFRAEGEQRVRFVVTADRVRHQKQD